MDKQEWMPKNPCKIAMCDPIPNDDCVNCDISTAFPHYQSEIAWYGKVAIAVWGIISGLYLIYIIYQHTAQKRIK